MDPSRLLRTFEVGQLVRASMHIYYQDGTEVPEGHYGWIFAETPHPACKVVRWASRRLSGAVLERLTAPTTIDCLDPVSGEGEGE